MRGSGFVAPVKVGDELDVSIEAVGEKGDGLAKKDGFVLFVPNTKQGDNVKIKVTRVLRKVGFAEVVGQAAQTQGSEAGEPAAQEEKQEDSEDFGDEGGENKDEPEEEAASEDETA
ncbi:TRAM domain-containing protein [Candidatus Woesearchaeota archaeon]|nr:TRAM domain-containing protein [Candidatus Woesearchaeota archaeon]